MHASDPVGIDAEVDTGCPRVNSLGRIGSDRSKPRDVLLFCLVGGKFKRCVHLGRANAAKSETRFGHKTTEVAGSVGPTITKFRYVVDEVLQTIDSLGAAVVIGAMVKPMLGVAALTLAISMSAQVGCPNFSMHKPIAEAWSSREYRAQVSSPHAFEMLVVGLGMSGSERSVWARTVTVRRRVHVDVGRDP